MPIKMNITFRYFDYVLLTMVSAIASLIFLLVSFSVSFPDLKKLCLALTLVSFGSTLIGTAGMTYRYFKIDTIG